MPPRRHSQHNDAPSLFPRRIEPAPTAPPYQPPAIGNFLNFPFRPQTVRTVQPRHKLWLKKIFLFAPFIFLLVVFWFWGKFAFSPAVQFFWETISSWRGAQVPIAWEEELTRLRLQVALLQSELERKQEILSLSQMVQESHFSPGQYAQILIRNPDTWFSRMVINRGSAHKVEKNSAVLCAYGALGVVRQILPYHSTVFLITDPAVYTGVLIQRKYVGLARGNGRDMEILFADPDIPVKVGDLVETSGQDGIFPSFLPVGVVKKVYVDSSISALRAEASAFFPATAIRIVLLLPPQMQPQ